jgi:dTDP-4-dehydrorhamnose 3,5-epimerase
MRAESLPELPEVLLLHPEVHADARGWLFEPFHAATFERLGLPTVWAQDVHSASVQGTVRGLHLQLSPMQGKLVRVLAGAILDVVVDLRAGSPTRRRWVAVPLRAEDRAMLWVPPGFAHGFSVPKGRAEVHYRLDAPRDVSSERALRWNDPALGIDWGLPSGIAPVLSERDSAAAPLAEILAELDSLHAH